MSFNNNASHCLFVGNRRLDEVIAQDTHELEQIGGSFEAIADRIDSFIEKIEGVYVPQRAMRRKAIFREYGFSHDELLRVPGRDDDLSTPRGKIMAEINALYRTPGLIPGETEIELVDIIRTRGPNWIRERGIQECPYVPCGSGSTSSSDYVIRNTRTSRKLWINQMTSHLTRAHHLLEKGNNYGISAREFYVHFMPGYKPEPPAKLGQEFRMGRFLIAIS